jgi:hypothetical protein
LIPFGSRSVARQRSEPWGEARRKAVTLYLHFVSMEDAFQALSVQRADDLNAVEHFFERSDTLERPAIGIEMFLLRGVADRV